MKVRELMTTNVGFCGPRTNAAAIAEILWSRDCGSIPVVDEKNRILGIVTDRDLFIALGTRNRRASDVTAEEVMTKDVATCSPDDDVKQAVGTMQARKVRRIPVVDRDRILRGMLSIYDVVQAAAPPGSTELPAAHVLNAMARLNERATNKVPALAAARS
jgi:CBS domain-containing protein